MAPNEWPKCVQPPKLDVLCRFALTLLQQGKKFIVFTLLPTSSVQEDL